MRQLSDQRPAFAQKRDFIILGIILALLAAWTLWFYLLEPRLNKNEHLRYAWIYYENTLIEKVPLDGTEKRWKLKIPEEEPKDHPVDIIVETFADKSIAVMHSNCPDHICMHTGHVSREGQSIACLPNHVIIKIGTEEAPAAPGLDG